VIGSTSPQTDYLDAQAAVVVSVTWAGRTWRLSTGELSGPDMHADPGLLEEPEISDEISLSPGGDVGVTVSIAFVLPAVSIAEMVGLGYDLVDLEAEVAWVWHRRGVLLHAWSAREVRAQGQADEPEWGDPTKPLGYISCSVEDSPYRTQRPLCRWSWEVSLDTWSASLEIGVRYPLVIGTPDPTGAGFGPPAPVLTSAAGLAVFVLVSIGWCRATDVSLVDSTGAVESFPIVYLADGLGQLCAIVNVSGAAVIIRTGTYTSAWTAGPAIAPMGGSGPIHLAAYLLALGGADIDLPEWARVASLMNLPVGGFVDDPETQAWEVARDLLTGLPVTMRRTRDGWSPVVLDPHLAASTAVAVWRDGGPWRRASVWAPTGGARLGRVEVSSEVSEIRVGATDARDAALPHAWIRHLDPLNESGQQLAWSWSATTDWRVLSWAARIGALGWEAAAFQVPAQWGQEHAGEWVNLADDDRHALVQRRTLPGGVWDYALVRPRGR
jgi:hypothetical protein